MGYLDNTSVTVDAILTNKGRQVLANGGQLAITKFALADDEVDYNLWNPAHSLGTNYYGSVIENMPVLEASPDETQMLRYKLVTLPKTAISIPVVTILPNAPVTFTRMSDSVTINVTTNIPNSNTTLGYTAILSDNTVASLEPAPDAMMGGATTTNTSAGTAERVGVRLPNSTGGTGARAGSTSNTDGTTMASENPTQAMFANYLDDEIGSMTTSGNTVTRTSSGKFLIRPKGVIGTKSALITIIANETGGFKTIVVTCTNTTTERTVDNMGNIGQ